MCVTRIASIHQLNKVSPSGAPLIWPVHHTQCHHVPVHELSRGCFADKKSKGPFARFHALSCRPVTFRCSIAAATVRTQSSTRPRRQSTTEERIASETILVIAFEWKGHGIAVDCLGTCGSTATLCSISFSTTINSVRVNREEKQKQQHA